MPKVRLYHEKTTYLQHMRPKHSVYGFETRTRQCRKRITHTRVGKGVGLAVPFHLLHKVFKIIHIHTSQGTIYKPKGSLELLEIEAKYTSGYKLLSEIEAKKYETLDKATFGKVIINMQKGRIVSCGTS